MNKHRLTILQKRAAEYHLASICLSQNYFLQKSTALGEFRINRIVMKILLSLVFCISAISFYSCKKEQLPSPSPAPLFARIHFLHKFRAENIADLMIHRFELSTGQWTLLDSAKTDAEGIIQFSYPVSTEYQLRIVSDIYQNAVYQMVPSRNSGLLTLTGETDCQATYTGSVDYINNFRVRLY